MWKRHDHSSDYFREKGITVFQFLVCSKVTEFESLHMQFFLIFKKNSERMAVKFQQSNNMKKCDTLTSVLISPPHLPNPKVLST